MLRELGLGLVLMLAGDGELARRAGDALIREKVQDAIAEGGFEEVAYAGWDKGYREGRFWVGFDAVAVVRRGARLEASAARIFPLSVDLEFEDGQVVTAASARSWSFDRVTVDGQFSLFSEGLEVRGAGLEDAAAEHSAASVERFCLFREGCAYEVSFGSARVPAFALELARRGGGARVHFAWEEREGCVELLLEDVSVPRGTALAALGEGLLADRWPATAVLREGSCATAPVPRVGRARMEERAPWASRDPRIDEMLAVLLVALPEAYAYLVD